MGIFTPVPLLGIILAVGAPILLWLSGRGKGSKSRLADALEHADGRRAAQKKFKKETAFYEENGISSTEVYFHNSRGVEQFSKEWLPLHTAPRAVVVLCHGYSDTITYSMEDLAIQLAKSGLAVAGVDHEGHGLSQGLHVYIHRFESIVDDIIEFGETLRERKEFQGLPFFLYGESMGGAVALRVHLRQPSNWRGAVLLAPMCAIAKEMTPPKPVITMLRFLSNFFPTLPIVPTGDIMELAFRVPEKRERMKRNPVAFGKKPRLKSAIELYDTTITLARSLRNVSLPLLILHGSEDRVTDPALSKNLYEEAASTDKTFLSYEGAWHGLYSGEPDEVVAQVFHDVTEWIIVRSADVKEKVERIEDYVGSRTAVVE